MELKVSRSEYGLMVVGDRGNLSFQSTRYLGFERMFGEKNKEQTKTNTCQGQVVMEVYYA